MVDINRFHGIFDALSQEDVSQHGRGDVLDRARELNLASLSASDAPSNLWAKYNGELRDVSSGLREVALASGKADQATLAALYFALLASSECPVRFVRYRPKRSCRHCSMQTY
jgi:hypothetical protein